MLYFFLLFLLLFLSGAIPNVSSIRLLGATGDKYDSPIGVFLLANQAYCLKPGPQTVSSYVTIEELYARCQIPGPCRAQLPCEGQIITVKGYIDYNNVFDKAHYPHLPYEKFMIKDEKGNTLEVWTLTSENQRIFEMIYQNKATPKNEVFLKGKIVGVDMPIQAACHRGIRLNMEKASDIQFSL